MSALNSFAETLSDGGITNFEISSMRFIVEKMNNFIFIASTLNKTKERKAIEELKIITEKFFEVYPLELLETWDNEISVFSDFGTHIERSMEKAPVDKFKEAFW